MMIYPVKNFNALIYSGNASTNNTTGVGFHPTSYGLRKHCVQTIVGLCTIVLEEEINLIFAEDTREEDVCTSTQDLVAFDSDGFTVGSSGI